MLTDKSTKQLSAMGLIASFNCVALMSSDVYASSIEATKLQSVVMSEKTQTDTVLEGIRGRLRGEPGQTHLIYLNQHENEFRSVIEEKWSKPYTAAYCDFLDRNFKADEMTQISKFFETPAGRYFTQSALQQAQELATVQERLQREVLPAVQNVFSKMPAATKATEPSSTPKK